MGTRSANSIIANVSLVLQDTTNVQWPVAELLSWLNDGQSQIVLAKPDASPIIANITTVAGTRQTIPATWNRLLDVLRNMGTDGITPGRSIMRVNRHVLDMHTPDWHSATPSTEAKHYTFDPRLPTIFYTYPPMVAGRKLEVCGSVSPALVTDAANPITLDDIYAPVLHDYMLYRAYTKDNGDQQLSRAASHYKAFRDALGDKGVSDVANDQGQQAALGNG